eukprot:CAMPEP_0204558394 /NCGR_PEP_ID=MMETSP0661-20131031/31066_1 /ASSEMBLY_ACC=CAM_ASM_000606 /TAXON_ID=109239 /ORGANISM="Alexandrium margalefi, Strain AMGDE01CS-322" /LENGTH=84 /DNA_ID=CAMNT_0051565569 /DNA_START=1 /DNA_END=253 /DNA_ORIENTATION=-
MYFVEEYFEDISSALEISAQHQAVAPAVHELGLDGLRGPPLLWSVLVLTAGLQLLSDSQAAQASSCWQPLRSRLAQAPEGAAAE